MPTYNIHLLRCAAILACLITALPGCVQFKPMSLYDGAAAPTPVPKPKTIALAVAPVIFKEDASYFWVTDNPKCTTGSLVSDVAHSGRSALKINWNRDPAVCEWAGFGIGWDNWSGKDLSEIYDHAALQMQVRTQEGTMFGLPIVLTLEDYSGKMAWSYVANKYFERYYIDEQWQQVTVPLNTFDLEEDGIDIGNVKQLMFELQSAGALYFDDIEIVFHEPKPAEVWLPQATAPALPEFPVQLFGDAFINGNGWGLVSDHCQKTVLTEKAHSEGSKAIHATWDKAVPDCYMVAIGISWNQWFPIDMRPVKATAAIEFDIKSAGGTFASLPINIGFEDYERQLSLLPLEGKLVDGGQIGPDWARVRIPLSELPGSANFGNIKQFVMQMSGAGEVYIDNIRLVREGI